MDRLKLTFFENIYYWLWYCLPEIRKQGKRPVHQALSLLFYIKFFNGFSGSLLLTALLKKIVPQNSFIETLLANQILLLIFLLFFLISSIQDKDEKKYENRFDIICAKIEILTPKQRTIKILTFFLYIILSAVLVFYSLTTLAY